MHDAEESMARVLDGLGFDDPEMAATPSAFVALLREFRGDDIPPAVSTFPASGGGPVILRNMPYYSLCAHHLLPFFGHAEVAYRPGDVVAGLGAVARVLHHHARRPQLQERLVEQVAETLWRALAPEALVVRLVARQLCMEMRGARTPSEVEVWAARGPDAEALAGVLGR